MGTPTVRAADAALLALAHDECRDPRRWARRQHVRERRGHARRRRHARGARHRRWRGAPVGLHPVEGADRDRRRARRARPRALDGPAGGGSARHRRAARAGGVDRGPPAPVARSALLDVAAGARRPGHRPVQGPARDRRRDRPTGCEEIDADFVARVAPAHARASPTSSPSTASVCSRRAMRTRRPRSPSTSIVIGSGVTGVEFTHLFDSLGSRVTLLVSRQQVLPIKDAEVAAVLEEAFLERGVTLLKGARANGDRARDGDTRPRARATTARVVEGSHAVLAVGSIPNTRGPRVSTSPASRSTIAATSA